MTTYEFKRWLTFPAMPTLLNTVRKDILFLVNRFGKNGVLSILDVGGRRSPYTINVSAKVTILDVPMESEVQTKLNLGVTSDIFSYVKRKRSNIKEIIIEDMTKSTLPEGSYDAVLSVEVIEHVEEDELFIANIAKVIKQGGWAYFTTPNGDYIKNIAPHYNPDHKRHYTKTQLTNLLKRHFSRVEVKYAVKTGKYRSWGLKSFAVRRPYKTLKAIIGNVLNRIESKGLENQQRRTAHLIAIVYK